MLLFDWREFSAGMGGEDKLHLTPLRPNIPLVFNNPNTLNNQKQEVFGMSLISFHCQHSDPE